MSRPTKHPKTGIYWLRRRIPTDLVEKLGRKEVTKSLETRDPDEAKRKHAALLLDLDAGLSQAQLQNVWTLAKRPWELGKVPAISCLENDCCGCPRS